MQGEKFALSDSKENHISLIIMESSCLLIKHLDFYGELISKYNKLQQFQGTKICMFII